jgi:glycosyltransferase involved in cell wall biosynthesis
MKKGLVSIVTPCYNSAKYIEHTVKSVQAQDHTNWEMILVDDCSADNTVEVAKRIQEKEPRVKLIPLEENSGPAVARNTGIEAAQGQYLTFLDADDLWLPNFISRSIEETEKGRPFVFASYQRKNENLEPLLSDFVVPQKVSYSDILKSNSISCLTAFLDVEKLGKKLMPLVRKRQDMGLWLRYLKDTKHAYGIQEPLAIYRIRESSVSRDKKGLIKHQWYFYREVEELNVIQSAYYLSQWAIRGFLKYRN